MTNPKQLAHQHKQASERRRLTHEFSVAVRNLADSKKALRAASGAVARAEASAMQIGRSLADKLGDASCMFFDGRPRLLRFSADEFFEYEPPKITCREFVDGGGI